MPLLEVKNLHVTVDGKQILNGLDLTVSKGEVHAIMGPNGSGKSTLAYVMAGKPGYEVDRRADPARRRGHSRACSRTSAPPRACSWRSSIRWKFPASPP